jgi:hypothetical protein
MKYYSLITLVILGGCTTLAPNADFKLTALDGAPGCQVLMDGSNMVTNTYKGQTSIFAIGDSCPKSSPSNEALHISKKKSVVFDNDGKLVRMYSFPDKNTGKVSKKIMRRNMGGYRSYDSKVMPPV